VSNGGRLVCETLLFSRRHDRARSDPPQYLLVPREELAKLRADIRWFLFGHPLRVYVRSARVMVAAAVA
jgi:hypothetical protein